jgi:hypothetical protein
MVDLAFGTGPFFLAFQRGAIFSLLFHAVGLQPIHSFELVDDLTNFNVTCSMRSTSPPSPVLTDEIFAERVAASTRHFSQPIECAVGKFAD